MKQRPHLDVITNEERRHIPALTLNDLLAVDFPPRKLVIDPWLPEQGLAMVAAKCGVGKTQLSVSCSLMMATGTPFLRWHAPKPFRVLFVDGEMPGPLLQERFAQASARLPGNASMPSPDYLKIITPDMVDGPMPDLNTRDGQGLVEDHLEGVDVVILDNISTLFRSGAKENDEDSWRDAQAWILSLRRAGLSTLLIHHMNKGGTQRGTSKREDVLDTSIRLTRPEDYRPQEGARFEVHFEKARGVVGEAALPFEAWLQSDVWTTRTIEDLETLKVLELKGAGMTQREIAAEVGFSAAKVNRILKAKEGSNAAA